MDELTREFLIESQEGLDRMERCLTDLEERPQDTELLGEIFRSVHTIKGTTGFLGFKRLERLAHAGENLLGLLRDGKLLANQPIITGLLQLMDALRGILRTIEADNNEGAHAQQDTRLIELMHQLQHPEPTAVGAARRSDRSLQPLMPQPSALHLQLPRRWFIAPGPFRLPFQMPTRLLRPPRARQSPYPNKRLPGRRRPERREVKRASPEWWPPRPPTARCAWT